MIALLDQIFPGAEEVRPGVSRLGGQELSAFGDLPALFGVRDATVLLGLIWDSGELACGSSLAHQDGAVLVESALSGGHNLALPEVVAAWILSALGLAVVLVVDLCIIQDDHALGAWKQSLLLAEKLAVQDLELLRKEGISTACRHVGNAAVIDGGVGPGVREALAGVQPVVVGRGGGGVVQHDGLDAAVLLFLVLLLAPFESDVRSAAREGRDGRDDVRRGDSRHRDLLGALHKGLGHDVFAGSEARDGLAMELEVLGFLILEV
mmetsp:Transcript_36162/g.78225  ORF Transcript_36162/g.78225 Transcript_36162/m.78225 type:complete len:265 (+) Transcript_36162:6386-7180(+)